MMKYMFVAVFFSVLFVKVLSSNAYQASKLRLLLSRIEDVNVPKTGENQDNKLVGAEIHPINVQRKSNRNGRTEEERDTILDLHNTARRNVFPVAKNGINSMHWDDNLESIAQDYASKCVWGHNNNRNSEGYYNYVGENMYAQTQTEEEDKDILHHGFDAWKNEEANYDYDNNDCAGVCGHYTQIVWADSTALGCGLARCSSETSPFRPQIPWVVLVCNYGPGGNWIGQKPYI